MSFGAVHHVGVVVPAFDAIRRLIEVSGAGTIDAPVEEPDLGIAVMWAHVGGLDLEFIRPLHEDARAAGVLRDGAGGVHHIAFAVDDIDRELAALERSGTASHGGVRVGVGGARIAFLDADGTDGTLVELVEPPTRGALAPQHT